MASEELDEEFLSGLQQKHETWQHYPEGLHSNPSPVLYDYTDATVFLGIVEGRVLWASNAAFLNDSTELIYVRDVLAEVVTQLEAPYREQSEDGEADVAPFSALVRRLAGTVCAPVRSWAAMTISLFDLLPGIYQGVFDVYVSCFCTDGDLLSQWRGYPSSGGGYALGFHPERWGTASARYVASSTTPTISAN